MEQVLHTADTWDPPHALFELGYFGDTINFATQDYRAVLAVDVQMAFGHVPVAEQLALDPLTESFIVGHVGRARHEVNDAVRDAVGLRRRASPKMFEAPADPSEACRKPIAQHVTAPSASLAIEEKHS